MKYNDPQNRAIIGGCRYCGKTTELIKMAARFNCLIVCASPNRAIYTAQKAQEMGLFIERPQDIRTLIAKPELLHGREVHILVDDVEDVLAALFRQNVVVMSTCAHLDPMKCLKEEPYENNQN